MASACPDAYAEMPVFPKFWYVIAVDAIEKNGGPSLIDRVAPAGWLIERAMKARWPRCIDAARPYIAKARKGDGPTVFARACTPRHSRRGPGRLHLALQDIEIAFEVMVFRLVCQLAQETERDTPRVLEL